MSFRIELEAAINCHSKESGSNTPDFILARYLQDCLAAFDNATLARSNWYGNKDKTIEERHRFDTRDRDTEATR